MAIGPIGVSSSSASSSVSSAAQSLSFNPVITLASPESNIRNQPSTDQTNSTDARATAESKAETRIPAMGDDPSTGFAPLLSLAGNRGASGAPATLAGDLVGGGRSSGGGGFDLTTLALFGGLAVAAYFIAKRFL